MCAPAEGTSLLECPMDTIADIHVAARQAWLVEELPGARQRNTRNSKVGIKTCGTNQLCGVMRTAAGIDDAGPS